MLYMKEGTVIQSKVLQFNIDNINELPQGKHPTEKLWNVSAWESNPRNSACKVNSQTTRSLAWITMNIYIHLAFVSNNCSCDK